MKWRIININHFRLERNQIIYLFNYGVNRSEIYIIILLYVNFKQRNYGNLYVEILFEINYF